MRKTATNTRRIWRGLPSWQRLLLLLVVFVGGLVQLGGSSAAPGDPPSVIGDWSAPQPWPIVAVHMSLEPTGQVLAFDGFSDAPNSERLWDPASGTFLPVPYGRNLFCSGHVQLADGRTLIVGGHVNANEGLADTTIFNPATNTYFRGPDMSVGRWYPTVTQLPDGRVLAFAGDNIQVDQPGDPPFRESSVNSLPSVYNPTTNTWTDLGSARLTSPLYPFMFVLSDGRVFDAGPDRITRTLNVATSTWTTVGTSPFDGMSAVMYRPNKIMKAGTWADPGFRGTSTFNAHGRTAVIDMSAPTPAWRETAAMSRARAYQNLTLLPDGTVLASGGGSTSDGVDIANSVLPAEIWNPDTETWTEVDALQNGRLYHSTALLLPDGRVLMAGGGQLPSVPTIVNQRNAEIYSPPYLFKGPRPTISSAPAAAGYGDTFQVTTPNAASISRVSLIRLPSVTHATDMNQRFQFLNFTAGAGNLTVTAPANANLAPPGDYMLFVVDTNGVPSVASMVRVSNSSDTSPPTAPTALVAAGSTGQVALSWGAATDPSGIARYNVHRGATAGFTPSAANRVGQPTGTSYIDGGLTAGTYYYRVTAEDTAGNVGPASNEASGVVPAGPPPGLKAAYGFDEGSGGSAADQSGNGNTGTLSNATWATAGKYGKALSFNGTNALVSVADSSSLDLTAGLTLEGWVNPTVSNDWQTLIVKERPGDLVYGLYSSTNTNVPQSQVTLNGTARLLNGTAQIPAGAWTHVAVTYDGAVQRLYVNGNQVSTLAVAGTIDTSTSPLRIGGNTIWSEWFNGLIDEVRIYDRALTAAQIQVDMANAISAPDTQPPGAPGTLTATGGLGQVGLAWGAAGDNVGVARYNVHRSTAPGFTPSAANRIAQPTATSYIDSGLTPGTYYYRVIAEDAVGNLGPATNEASAVATADTTPPTAPATLTATPAPGQISLSWSASTDSGGIARYNVHRGTTAGFSPTTGNRIAQPTGTSYVDSGLSGGTYYYRVTAEDPAGNVSAPSPEANAAVPTGPPPGLVGEWGFDAGAGTTALDSSGTGNTGTIAGPLWTTAGRFGNALTFDGVNDLVTIADANSLDLTNGMTLEAWVRPSSLGNAWRTALMKERPGSMSYGLYANGGGGTKVPTAEIFTTTFRDASASAQLAASTWTHIAAAYNGSALTVYVNGVQAGQLLTTGSIVTGTGALRVGGNTTWGEYFQGDIDEVRVYNRALTAAEIQADMTRPVTNPDSVAPSAPGTLSATGNLTGAQLGWGAATDNTAVTRYNVHRSTTPAFTPSVANRIAQPAGTSYTDTVAAGTYYYRVTAEDAAGNVGPSSNEASAQAGDVTAPGAPGTLTATGAIGQASLSWGAASDNVGVTRYNVHRGPDSSFVPSAANRIAQPTGTSYVDAVAPGTYAYKVTAEDAAGNVGPASNAATATVTADTAAPTAPTGLTSSVTGSTANLSWTAATDNVAVTRYNVHRSTTPGFTPSLANRIAQPTGTSYPDSGLAAGTYYYRVTAEDAAGNVSGSSNEQTATVADATPPTAPTAASASATGSTINVTWTAATDNIGVARYNVHRGATSGFTPSVVNRIAQPTGTSYADVGLAPGTYFYKVAAEDAAGNIGGVSNTASATVLDTTAPTAPAGLAATGGAGQAALSWTAATDNVAVTRYNVHRGTTAGFTPSTGNRIAQPTTPSYTDTSLAAGTYYYKVTAEDAAGNVGPVSNEASATVSPPPLVGLVGAYGFDEGTGTTTADQSGSGNGGSVSGATWTASGKFGSALTFDGVNDLVTIADANSLDLTTGLTLEAWVRPSTVSTDWRTAIMKEQPGGLVYSLYAAGTGGTKVPLAEVYIGGFRDAVGSAVLPAGAWTHLASTYDGSVLALFVNGVQVGQLLQTGSMAVSTGALRIGGNTIWGEYFQGEIDEVRVYNRARTSTEIQADMNTSISSPDVTPPTAPGTLTATGGLGQIGLSWGAATDNVVVARYNVHRSTAPGFTPSAANRIAQPTGTSYSDSGLAAGTYYYKVTAEDTAGNVGPAGNEASAVAAADTTPPTVAITSPAAGATVSGFFNVTANASDNGTVAGVQFKADGANVGAEDTTAPYSATWDTFGAGNGPHTLTAVARDVAGNVTTSASVGVTVSNTAAAGLVGAWALDENGGTAIADQSGRGNNGTHSNGIWTPSGQFNAALTFNGTNAWVTVPDSSSLDLTTGMTVEAWVRPTVTGSWRTAVLKEQTGNLVYGLYTNTTSNRPTVELFVNGSLRSLSGTAQLPTGVWSHLAASFDGATIRLFVNGLQSAQLAAAGSMPVSTGVLRIGGNGIWGEYFNGTIDEVRVYNRALSASEIQSDMVRSITPDTTRPTILAQTPANGAAGVNVGTSPTARFSEAMNAGSITTTTFQLKDAGSAVVPATVSYDPASKTATLTPQAALQYGASYTVTVKGGAGGVADLAGNTLLADITWSFSTEASPPPILVVGSTANAFGLYLGEILRSEGLDAFTTIDVAFLSPALLAQFDVVVLGETALNATQVTTLTNWVNGGGNLVAMRPDKQLAGLLGLTDAAATLTNTYLQVNTATSAGAGIVGSTIQYHGTADRYTLTGATSIATLFSNATTATANPAVTLRSVGGSGGQAAAFTYDLARSVVYTRQGNPAWAGQERDGAVGIRPNDLFYGARAGDVQPDWVDTNKIAIPQADEQQRLLLNLITVMERDKLPLPRFWYLPRGEKAVVVMSGDDHSPTQAPGGTASHFDRYKALSPTGCSVANWECVRSSSYVYPNSNISNAAAAAYQAEGFEVGLHPLVASCPAATMTQDELNAFFVTQLAQWEAKYTSVTAPVSSRTHCVYWPDWASNAKVELGQGMRMDANYYHYPATWIGTKPGFMTGGGFPMRFADLDGTQVDVYQANTNLNDEATANVAPFIDALLDNAVGPLGYYGAFGVNMHTDNPAPHPGAEAVVASALARGVPVISYKQLLTWADGRNASTIRGLSWSAGTFTFVTTVGAGATGLQTMLPLQGPAGTLTSITRAGSPVPFTVQTIKGIGYAFFDTATATYRATYA